MFYTQLISDDVKNTIIGSIQISNEEPVVGENIKISTDEIKNLVNLKVIILTSNNFEKYPLVLDGIPNLEVYGFEQIGKKQPTPQKDNGCAIM